MFSHCAGLHHPLRYGTQHLCKRGQEKDTEVDTEDPAEKRINSGLCFSFTVQLYSDAC